MTRLFIELYLDEDVSTIVATLIRAREEGRLGQRDHEQLAYATEQERAILTHNRDDYIVLAKEYYASGRNHYGIIIARHHSPYEIVRSLITILDQVAADEFQNQVRIV